MKKIAIVALLMLSLLACNKENTETAFESTAVITGQDMALCACCGGWMIQIDGSQVVRQFSNLPASSSINLKQTVFPISVNLNWAEAGAPCNLISIDEIELK